jgi:hypothetical protein
MEHIKCVNIIHTADRMSLTESSNNNVNRIEKRPIIVHVVYVINLLLIY